MEHETKNENGISNGLTREIIIPPGRLRMILKETPNGFKIHKILRKSPMHGKVKVGTTIISLNDETCIGMSIDEFVYLLETQPDQNRTLTILELKEESSNTELSVIDDVQDCLGFSPPAKTRRRTSLALDIENSLCDNNFSTKEDTQNTRKIDETIDLTQDYSPSHGINNEIGDLSKSNTEDVPLTMPVPQLKEAATEEASKNHSLKPNDCYMSIQDESKEESQDNREIVPAVVPQLEEASTEKEIKENDSSINIQGEGKGESNISRDIVPAAVIRKPVDFDVNIGLGKYLLPRASPTLSMTNYGPQCQSNNVMKKPLNILDENANFINSTSVPNRNLVQSHQAFIPPPRNRFMHAAQVINNAKGIDTNLTRPYNNNAFGSLLHPYPTIPQQAKHKNSNISSQPNRLAHMHFKKTLNTYQSPIHCFPQHHLNYFYNNHMSNTKISQNLKHKPKMKETLKHQIQNKPVYVNALHPTDFTFEQISQMPVCFSFYLNDKTSEDAAIIKQKKWTNDMRERKRKEEEMRKSEEKSSLTKPEPKRVKVKRKSIPDMITKEGIYPAPDLPDGWTVEYIKRKNGLNKDKFDKYWYSPKTKCRFRSKTGLAPFIEGVKEAGGDEIMVYNRLKKSGIIR